MIAKQIKTLRDIQLGWWIVMFVVKRHKRFKKNVKNLANDYVIYNYLQKLAMIFVQSCSL